MSIPGCTRPAARRWSLAGGLHMVDSLDSTGSGMLPPPLHPIRSPISTSSHATDREAYPNSASFVARSHLSPGSQGTFGSYPTDTPRNAFAIPGLSSSNPSYPNSHSPMAAPGYPPSDCANFPWPTLEIHAEMSCDGQAVTPEVHAKVEKGFFPSSVDGKWTCYRRNYFSVQCNFELHPSITNGRMCLKRSGSTTTEFIQAMGMRLSAAVDGSAGKNIELVQHTPKRDAGPKNKIEVVKVSPSASGRSDHTVSSHGVYAMGMPAYHATGSYAGPLLPLQGTSEGGSSSSSSAQSSHLSSAYPYSTAQTQSPHMPIPGNNTQHVFERVQFKQATANNGKRRASQQYFHLIVELFADVRKEGSDTANWVKVAHRVSEKIVVRGRSPSHYHNEGQNGHGGRTGSTGGSSGGYSATGGASYASMGSTPFRGSGSAYGGGLANSGSYRTTAYGFQPQSDHSGSSASSVDGGAADADYPNDTAMSDAERSSIQDHAAYRYYPAPIYEAVPQAGLPLPKIESAARYSTDPSSWAVKHEYGEAVPGAQWPVSGLSRFQGVESSRGYFPTELGSSHYS